MRHRAEAPLSAALAALGLLSCQNLEKFDTKNGAAYCGSIASAQFIRTVESEGGFQRDLRLSLVVDANHLTTAPGKLTTDDAKDGPCAPTPTFDHAELVVTPEIVSDPLSTMTFAEDQVQNLVAWAETTCRGPVLAVVSLRKNDHVDVRLLKPKPATPAKGERDAFAFFPLARSESGCGF